MTTNQTTENTKKTQATKSTNPAKSAKAKKQTPPKSSIKKQSAPAKSQTALAPAKPITIIDKVEFSKRLEKTTENINRELNGIVKSFCKIGHELYEVRENKTYLGLDYKSVVEYAESAFHFQKSSVSNYISICERFSVHKNGKPTAQLLPEFEKFSYGQLSIMLSLPAEKLPEITPDKSCSEIREIKIQEKIKRELQGSGSGTGISGKQKKQIDSVSSSSNLVEYVIGWYYSNEPVPLKTANIKISADKADKIYKEICVLLNNDWYDFGCDGDSLTVNLVNKSDGGAK